MHWNKLQNTLIFKIFRESTPFPCAEGVVPLQHLPNKAAVISIDSALATLQFPTATFFNLKTLYVVHVLRPETKNT